MTDESPSEKQHNEIEALQAIFGDDLKDLRGPSAWKLWKPLDILLTLYPQQGSSGNQEIHCTIGLHVMCPPEYPEIEPKLEVKNSKGLSDSQIKVLLSELETLSSSLKGEVMIFELAQYVQTFLHRNNKPGFKSFYEEMMSRQKQDEQMRLREEDKERQEMKDEILRRKEILKMEMKLRKETRHGLCMETSVDQNSIPMSLTNEKASILRQRQSTSECSDVSFCEHRGIKTINFAFKADRQVTRGRCLGHSERGCVVYGGLDAATGELLAVVEWIIELQSNPGNISPLKQRLKRGNSPKHMLVSNYDLSTCMRQIASVEQELSFLMKLHHSNLVHYLNIKYTNENNTLMVYLLQEFVLGGNVSTLYLNDKIIMEVDVLRHFATGLLEAIDHLHRNNVVHKDIRDTNVFIDKMGTIRLADYSIDRRLMELYQGGDSNARYSKKQDIFRIGMLLVSLLKGEYLQENHVDVPENITPDLRDFVFKCVDENERSRCSAEQLLKHQFIKTPIHRLLPKKSIDHNDQSGSDGGQDDSQGAIDLELFIPTGSSGQSRIKNEFEIMKWLGKGAFGDVLKVKNKLDGGCYALKRIELNPKNKQLNKKITREVKLLSRLNHENVVRYYNSWIESATLEQKNDYSSSNTSVTTVGNNKPADRKNTQFPFVNNDDIENLAPPIHSVEWSVSYSSHSKQIPDPNNELVIDSSESEEDDDDDDDDDDVWVNFLSEIKTSSNSDSIEFKGDDSTTEKDDSSLLLVEKKHVNGNSQSDSGVDLVQIQYLYIQMEFCEKSTLRNAIDNGLHSDPDRVWRLFREIVEGLSHIHQQGMIHRDLKPVNIFLDSNDHVKIGDFGLATNILPKAQPIIEIRNYQEINTYSDPGDISLTGHVGTALYVAPELVATGNKAIYNQKVDIYSLGIILFEMSYMPLKTGMERVKVLGNLRSKDIVLPENFNTPEYSKQVFLISWLLNHDGSSRPTCGELLQCEQLPSAMEEYELKEVLRHALAIRSSKAYRHLINACFQQELTPAEDITYDMNLLKTTGLHHKQSLIITFVKEMVIKVFKLHGGVELTTPLLLPMCHLYDPVESSVRLMTHSGDVVHIPHDLRVPFARYIAWNGITMLKRYSIERVYREKKIFGFHPRELYECAFDIVTPTPGNLFAEAELLSIVYEISNQLPAMKCKNLAIHLNHTSLLKAILMNCGIEEEKYSDVYSILSDARDGKLSKFQVQTHLISLCLSDQAMVIFFSLMETECPIEKLSHILKPLLKKRGEVNVLARAGVKDLETIVHNAEILGVKCPILILPCMVYNVHQYSGMMCQFICELKKKRRKGAWDVIAAGGRYDSMLCNLRKTLQRVDLNSKSEVPSQAAAGISLSLERLVQGAMASVEDDSFINSTSCDVCVCSTSSSKASTKEKAEIVRTLWNAGIKANLIETVNLDEIQDICRDFSTTHIIIVTESEQGMVRVRSWERDRFQERKVATSDIVYYMQQLVKTWNEDSENISNVGSNTFNNIQMSKSESKINDFERQNSSMPNVSVNFITPEKLAANTRRRFENQILSQMGNTLQKISPKNRVEVLAVSLDGSVLRTLTSYLEVDVQQNDYDKAVKTIIEKHSRNKKYLMEVCDQFRDLAVEKNRPIIALYSLQDSLFKMFM
ncbi:eukaryotic translation initiation factor 2 alpha kinase Gcn2 isoform X2 [Arctopsyche grandis]|uniref:eukaryotic translation initiation factor 2 alpha kinase Gcn2 isoform X2 n=1 Tax=Arctopsyche grandis TaxID=121162 RepID=UPI00406D9929